MPHQKYPIEGRLVGLYFQFVGKDDGTYANRSFGCVRILDAQSNWLQGVTPSPTYRPPLRNLSTLDIPWTIARGGRRILRWGRGFPVQVQLVMRPGCYGGCDCEEDEEEIRHCRRRRY